MLKAVEFDSEINHAATEALVQQTKDRIARNTCRIFISVMLLQWIGAMVFAIVFSPKTWTGNTSSIHPHVWTAVILGGIITVFPVALAILQPTKVLTRHVIGAGQVLMSALLIHITGGRVETHFHVFGSLAILAFFRDWRVLITASIVVYFDHLVRGYYWPQSVYGTLTASSWRAIEHAWWVAFEVIFLIIAIRQSVQDIRAIAVRQAKLQKFNEHMEEQVKQRTSELDASNKHMETFCYSMSHDLKAPLRGIQAFSEILMLEHGDEFQTKTRDYLLRIQRSASTMNLLVNDLLTYTRVSREGLHLTPVDLKRVVDETVRLLAAQIEKQNATINVSPDLGTVIGHDATLIQVVLNLISNALTYSKPELPPIVSIQAKPIANRIRLEITDNGIGIEPQYHEKIFELFQRVAGENEHAGTGVGLAIVAKSIDRLGGKIGVDSALGKGSTFWFELPAAAPPIEIPAGQRVASANN